MKDMKYYVVELEFTAQYNELSSTNACGHVDGGLPYQCSKSVSSATNGCEYECTSVSYCIAYEEGQGDCWFIPNSTTCPSGWSVLNSDLHVATSSSDINVSNTSGYSCNTKQGK